QARAAGGFNDVKGFADGRQHAQSQAVHLENAQRVDVVLVPLNEGAVFHGRVFDGDQLVKPRACDDKPAHVLRQVARLAPQARDQLNQQGAAAVVFAHAGLAHASADAVVAVPPGAGFGHTADLVQRVAQDLTDVADRAAAAVGD